MIKIGCLLLLLLSSALMLSCARGDEAEPAVGSDEVSADTRLVVYAVANDDLGAVVGMLRNGKPPSDTLTELRSLTWSALRLEDHTSLQTITFGQEELQIGTDFIEKVRYLGELLDRSEIDEAVYINSMHLLDAMLSGVMKSHSRLSKDSEEQFAHATQSALTYAPLMRLLIASEFDERGFHEHNVLTQEQRELLKQAAQAQDFNYYDQLP